MSTKSKIEWTDITWNPATGCNKISPGCMNCYAETMSHRLQAMGVKRYENSFEVTLHEDIISLPHNWKSPKTVFVNSMSDLFHEKIPFVFIKKIFQTIVESPKHTFQILTKRSSRLAEIANNLPWPENLWIGVSIENSEYCYRAENLRKTPSSNLFISFEPLIGPIHNMNYDRIAWVIAGGESGPRARTIEQAWVIDIRNDCIRNTIPFFFKQWGGKNKKKTGRELEGRCWDQLPRSILLHKQLQCQLLR